MFYCYLDVNAFLILSSFVSLLFLSNSLLVEWKGQSLVVNPGVSIIIVKTTMLHLKDVSFQVECIDMYLFRIFLR
jgi:hypothetical protein